MVKRTEIANDGAFYNGERDPPGQVSVYIPPGDFRREQYRLATFQCFPKNSAVQTTDLAAAGFYYVGYRDRAKCFSCGAAIENWMIGDNPEDRRWHKSECDLADMRETQNIPMQKSRGMLKEYLADYLRPRPRDQILPTTTNSVSLQRTASLQQPYQGTQISSPIQNGTTEEMTTCLNPVNPHMRSLAARIDTFKNRRGVRWPTERLRAAPEELANAGLFYIGERDRVKCWYCNGGLQNWDYNDEPWVEHAKWFPTCEYVRSTKGTSYIRQVAPQYPNVPPIAQSCSRNTDVATKVQEAITQLDYVKNALEMGIDVEIITRILKQKYRQDGAFYRDEAQFYDAVFASGNIPNEGFSSERTSNTENTSQIGVNPTEPAGSQQPAIHSHQAAVEASRMEDELDLKLRSLAGTRLPTGLVLIQTFHSSMLEVHLFCLYVVGLVGLQGRIDNPHPILNTVLRVLYAIIFAVFLIYILVG